MTTMIPMFLNLGTSEILLIALVVLLLFGGKKIPELMRGVGKGVKSFKDGVSGVKDDINGSVNAEPVAEKTPVFDDTKAKDQPS